MDAVTVPDRRVCERCGRVDVWDDEAGTWVAATVDGERKTGRPHCVHIWDINMHYEQ